MQRNSKSSALSGASGQSTTEAERAAVAQCPSSSSTPSPSSAQSPVAKQQPTQFQPWTQPPLQLSPVVERLVRSAQPSSPSVPPKDGNHQPYPTETREGEGCSRRFHDENEFRCRAGIGRVYPD